MKPRFAVLSCLLCLPLLVLAQGRHDPARGQDEADLRQSRRSELRQSLQQPHDPPGPAEHRRLSPEERQALRQQLQQEHRRPPGPPRHPER